jgi:hypothetical protein
MKCTAGVRTAPMGAGWIWNTLADSAFSHHIPSLAPAVALPAPRHDRRRTGAAGSPPGGFPFVEFRHAVVKCVGGARRVAERLSFYRRRTELRSFPRQRESRPGLSGSPQRDARDASVAGCPSRGRAGGESRGTPSELRHVHARLRWTVGTRFATGRSPCGHHRDGVSGA